MIQSYFEISNTFWIFFLNNDWFSWSFSSWSTWSRSFIYFFLFLWLSLFLFQLLFGFLFWMFIIETFQIFFILLFELFTFSYIRSFFTFLQSSPNFTHHFWDISNTWIGMKLLNIFFLLLLEQEKGWKWLLWFLRIDSFFIIILLRLFWLSLFFNLLSGFGARFFRSSDFSFFLLFSLWLLFLLGFLDWNRFFLGFLLRNFFFNGLLIVIFDGLISHEMSTYVIDFLESLTQDLWDFVNCLNLIHIYIWL